MAVSLRKFLPIPPPCPLEMPCLHHPVPCYERGGVLPAPMAMNSDTHVAPPQTQALIYSGFRLHEQGLTPVGTPTKEEWFTCLHYLLHMEKHVHFWIGDLLNYGEHHWGQRYTDMLATTDFDYGTLRNLKSVASRIDVSRRHDNLSFSHHQEVASLPPDQQTHVLTLAETHGWTREVTRREVHRLTSESLRPKTPSLSPGLYRGDCREVLASLPDESIDLLLTDPPYGINYQSEHKALPDAPLVNDGLDESLQVLDETLAIASRKLKARSHVYIFTSWKTDQYVKPVVEKYFAIKNVLVWEKNNWTAGDLEANYATNHEFLLFGHYKQRRLLNGSREASVLHFPRVPENEPNRHPAQKPLPLLEYLIQKSTNEGETVLDCFMGSGSTCVAAKNTGRRYIGIEVSEHWYQIALQRLA